jgi:Ran-binding protein 3
MKMRVRQISQGVEDIKWNNRHAQNAQDDADIQLDIQEESTDNGDLKNGAIEVDQPTTVVEPLEIPAAVPSSDSNPKVEASGPPLDGAGAQAPPSDDTPPVLGSDTLSPDESDGGEKGLKRKFLERGTSQGPQEAALAASEPLKRPRDDADKDDNPRETKRPSPPPSPKTKEPKPV